MAVPDPDADGSPELPVVGDWVFLDRRPHVADPVIVEVLPRRTVISRRDPAKRLNEQVLAANVDLVFIVHGLDQELNLDADVEVSDLEDNRPAEDYVTFRCWDPDGTEIEVFWERPEISR